MGKFLVRKITNQRRFFCTVRRPCNIVGAWGAAAGDQPHPSRCEPPPPPHPVPGPTSRHSAVWSVGPGTGSNGEHCPRAIGNRSPPFGPMPLPSVAHCRRGMGCGGGRPTTHRGDHRPPPHPVPGPTKRYSAVWSDGPGTGSNGEHCPRAIGNRSPPFSPMPLPLTTRYRRGMG